MRTSELQTALQALDHLPMPDKTAALRRVNAYAKAGITALDPPAYPLPSPRPPLLRRPALAAVVALSVIGVSAGAVAGVDLYRYNTASDFFADYRLSTDGISRSDLWEVYRDMITGQFSLPATGHMLQSNMGLTPQGSLSAEEAESLWEGWKETHAPDEVIPLDVSYYIRVTHHDHVSGHSQMTARPHGTAFFTPDPTAEEDTRQPITDSDSLAALLRKPYSYTRDDSQTIHFKRLDGSGTVWSVPLDGMGGYVQYAFTDDYVAVAGYTDGEPRDTCLYFLSSEGSVLWSTTLNNGETQELPQYILFGEDTVTLFSWTDRVHICRTVFDFSGNMLDNSRTTLEKGPVYTIKQIIPFRDGHLLLMRDTGIDTSLYYMNAEGEITDRYGFEDGGGLGIPYTEGASGALAYRLAVDRILAANGYLYISLTGASDENAQDLSEWLRPYWDTEQSHSDGVGIIGGQDSFFAGMKGIPSEEYAARHRAIFRSFLLVCDPETMEIISVTVMDGAFTTDHPSTPGLIPSISANGNRELTWVVESPYATVFSPYTSSFCYSGSSTCYTFTLTPEGKVIAKPDVSTGWGFRH